MQLHIDRHIAVLITCHNRKAQTLQCLKALYSQKSRGIKFILHVFLVDDGSDDGTSVEVKKEYPGVNVISGSGNLYWAGGMRKAWNFATKQSMHFDFFLMINDDTKLFNYAIADLLSDFSRLNLNEVLITAGTVDDLNNVSYGGCKLINRRRSQYIMLTPNNSHPQICNLANANILLVPFSVYNKIGILSEKYTHGLADFDYSLRAAKHNISTYLASNVGGCCNNDHGNNWRSSSQYSLSERIRYLYSPKGLVYKEYIFYIKEHFPLELPIAFIKIWTKTFFPIIWEKFKS